MRTLRLALVQARFENRAFWRNPAAAFFTAVMPLMFLTIFNLLFQGRDTSAPGGEIDLATFYVPGITALAVVSACYTNIAMGIVYSRESGVLKRINGTPLPTASFIGGRLLQAVWVSIVVVGLLLAVGILLFGVSVQLEKLPAFFVTLVVGAAAFTALGLAISSFVPNEDAASPIINATVLPLAFISNVFIPNSSAPDWLNTVASVFPFAPFSNALHAAFNPHVSGNGFEFGNLAIVMAWGIAGSIIAAKFFAWEPKH